ncbi:MAG TPA: hypothetical protein VMH27_07790 [Puia sp.]|nr:hypothetical protein [Puia sp.]
MAHSTGKLTNPQVLFFSILFLLIPVAWIEISVLHATHGTLAYPLDDTFIHMAVARNLAFNHYWGISGHVFASTSSSPFYTILLAAAFKCFGARTVIPLWINLLAAIGVLIVMQRWLMRQGLSTTAQLILLLSVNFLTPLPLLVISGMEHTLQLLFTFLFIFTFAGASEATGAAGASEAAGAAGLTANRIPRSVYFYGALMISTRYDCLPILGLACLILLARRKWAQAILLGAVSILPITIFGLYSMSKGSFFMPTSVVLKAAMPQSLTAWARFFADDIWFKLFFSPHDYNFLAAQRLVLLLPLTYLAFLPQVRGHLPYKYILLILMGATLAHVAFAYPNNYPRYESYLVACSTLIIGTLIAKYRREVTLARFTGAKWIAAALLVLLFIPLFIRSEKVFQKSRQYCLNVYEQQYQMSQFVHRYYDSTPVAFNDIGAVSFYSEGDKLDLWGLASLEVAKAKRKDYWTPDFADSLIHQHQTRLAILYDTWYDPALLHRWTKVASWHNRHNVILGDDSVSFYAIRPEDTGTLRKNLESYQPSLPADVSVSYY